MGEMPFIDVRLGAARLAFPLDAVERVLRAFAVAPVPGAPRCLLGIADIAGRPTPIYLLRRLLGLPPKRLEPSDRVLITRGGNARGFVVDEVAGVVPAAEATLATTYGMEASGLRGVARSAEGILLMHDLERFMSMETAIPLVPHG